MFTTSHPRCWQSFSLLHPFHMQRFRLYRRVTDLLYKLRKRWLLTVTFLCQLVLPVTRRPVR